MRQRFKLFIYVAAALLAVPLVLVAVFAVSETAQAGEVLPRVWLGPVDVSGLSDEDAAAAVREYEDELRDVPATFVIDDVEYTALPDQVGFDIDEEAAVAAARAAGSGLSLNSRFRRWLTADEDRLPLPMTVDEDAARALLTSWADNSISQPAVPGSIEVVDGELVATYPQTGKGVDIESGVAIMTATFADADRPTRTIPVIEVEPVVSAADIDAGLAEATEVLAAPVELRRLDPEFSLVLRPEQLGAALVVEVGDTVAISLDPAVIDGYLTPIRAELEAPAIDAEVVVDDQDRVTIVPGQVGTQVDPELVAAQALAAAQRPARTGFLPLAEGVEPDFSTADAQALGIKGLVSEFTTEHPCCQPRVTNIHQMADLVDGTLVLPGEEFSLNAHVGQRTTEKGFVPAPMILNGEFVDSVGGGVSQFATTIYNAVFFGGYEDVTHKPHSFYFSRYPEGREATVSWPAPELIFRNNSEAAILIKTEYTDTSITVKFFGDNGGLKVEAWLSERSNFRNGATDYRADASVPVGSSRVVQRAGSGWDVTVGRVITYPDGTVTEQTWDVRYLAQRQIIEVHPCEVPGTSTPCPTTTTTTSTTTTTTPSSTTTAPTTTTTTPTTTTAPTTTSTTAPTTSTTAPTTSTTAPTTTTAPPTTTTTAPTTTTTTP